MKAKSCRGGPVLLGRNEVSLKVWEEKNDVAKPELKMLNLFRKIKVSYQAVQGWFEVVQDCEQGHQRRGYAMLQATCYIVLNTCEKDCAKGIRKKAGDKIRLSY